MNETTASEPAAAGTYPLARVRSRSWGAAAIVCFVLAALFVPVAITATWADRMLDDTDLFVATFAPLADDEQVQALVSGQVVAAIDEQLDIDALTEQAFDGIVSLGLPPRSSEAIRLLQGPAAEGVRQLIREQVDRFVASPSFAGTWTTALRLSHRHVVTAIAGREGGAISVSEGGVLGIELAPIVAEVRTRLVDSGIAFARLIPPVERTIVIAESDAFVTAVNAARFTAVAAVWAPWVVFILLVLGVVFLIRRGRGAIRATVIGAATMLSGVLLMMLALAITRAVVIGALESPTVPAGAIGVIADRTMSGMVATGWWLAATAVAIALGAWLFRFSPWAMQEEGPETNGSRAKAS